MFVRMTRVESSPDELDAAIPHYRDQVASQVKNLPGYLGAALHADRATGTRQSLMMWDSEDNSPIERADCRAATRASW